ncbi:MAG: trypsin-like peptidase domain-containing protein [Erysipelotrichaceae bacterium]|nr:trypsin-like peptidase domain-containing protein [Erysipelotrichaceae bacterium]
MSEINEHNDTEKEPEKVEYKEPVHSIEIKNEPGFIRKNYKKGITGFLVASLAFGGGYGGTMLALSMNQSDGTTVLYQTVNRTVDNLSTTDEGDELSIKEVAALTADSVVEISTEAAAYSYYMQQYVTSGSGSGVILSADGYIITCYHVIEGATKVTVRLNDGTEYDATIIGSDTENDISILKIDATDLQPAVLGDSDTMSVGDTVVAIGNPLGELGGTVTSGILSALDREITIDSTTMNLLQTNAAVNPGNSGGALFNAYGELIGIVNAKSSGDDVEGLGFAIPINSIKDSIEELISQGYVSGKRALGISIVDVTDSQTAQQYNVTDYGVYITAIQDNSLAESLGFEVGDRIVSINNIQVDSVSELQQLYSNCIAGETVTFKIMRSNTEQTISFTRD